MPAGATLRTHGLWFGLVPGHTTAAAPELCSMKVLMRPSGDAGTSRGQVLPSACRHH